MAHITEIDGPDYFGNYVIDTSDGAKITCGPSREAGFSDEDNIHKYWFVRIQYADTVDKFISIVESESGKTREEDQGRVVRERLGNLAMWRQLAIELAK